MNDRIVFTTPPRNVGAKFWRVVVIEESARRTTRAQMMNESGAWVDQDQAGRTPPKGLALLVNMWRFYIDAALKG